MAHDPVVALALWALAIVGALAALGSLLLWHFPLVKMLPVLGSVVFLLGSYFAARTLRDNELSKATEMLGSSALAVQIAGVHQLGAIGMNVPRFRTYAELALHGFVADRGDSKSDLSRQFADNVLSQLGGQPRTDVRVLKVKARDVFPAAKEGSVMDESTQAEPLSQEGFAAFSERAGDDTPVVMLNLLAFKRDGGRERYEEYGEAVAPLLEGVGGRIVFMGAPSPALLGEEAWDLVVLVEYPTRQAFLDMIGSTGYQAIGHLRTEALRKGELHPMDPA